MNNDQQNALAIHDKAREQVNSPPLIWSWQLADEAQTWADYLAGNDIGEARSRLRMPAEDLNQFVTTIQLANPRDPLTSISSNWNADKVHWHGKEIWEYCESRCKHLCYTQMIWNKTTHMGMAAASNGAATFVVARYWPAGNMVGERPVEVPVKGDKVFESSETVVSQRGGLRHPCV
ncbi:hypothetical protein M409DRAFT_19043 [Zasmidium cellare ATCC 36951]|uniref:SCP domain-containing protein n=1 Tax=Zasmidium cellare ATCC 36951 TaxID=1080233 RepID=A0A6A6CY11_ZASCE|nr:uncharacterized protein M409DRAFT_19043 [Zasmidium cellare ATCC 36951]KAF2171070.1 hypothetical protein M409DRAFT_19043 [Zasmidium cellare ATCC 36951]